MDDLKQWLGENLVIGDDLQSKEFPETGRGLCSCRTLSAGDVIVSIKLTQCFSAASVQLSSGSVIPQFIRDHPLECLTLFLVVESWMAERSEYAPYIRSLPREFTNPLFVLRGQLPENVDPHFDALLLQQHRDLRRGWKLICRAFAQPELEHFSHAHSKQRFLWAWFAVATRSLYIQADMPALVPFVDLLNHSPFARTRIVLDGTGNTFQLITEYPYKSDEQIFINYGSHDNTKLAVYYGFTITRNPLSEVKFSMEELLSFFPVTDAKMKFLRQYDLCDKFSCSWDGLSLAFLVFLNLRNFKGPDYWPNSTSSEI
ncbi:SET domain-containing protein 4-like isoform X2 [Paramacrobiotus metropolitanus]|uniref:SET domain-containing protein 4-like isoform X2 n=1 Tax=Paramacrobiotus metropolitanus TaxID=2943436 RepID=UPI002446040E|nr:SET domain-containing protein 4-like isoform X2 [Paramacrobiotus metropolitanus]